MATDEKDGPLDIDEHRLDFEWIRQPRLYRKYALRLAEAENEVIGAKNRLAVVEAELQLKVRDEPKEYNLGKVTEKSVDAVITTDREYQEALRELHKAEHSKDILRSMVSALDHKKKALEKLVDLHLAGYFATPRASEGSRETLDTVRKKSVRGGLNDG